MNSSGIIIIINYMLCLYGAFCFFNGLQLMKQEITFKDRFHLFIDWKNQC